MVDQNDFRLYKSYLAHYGVKGMRWGVRRDRAPTGSRQYHSRYSLSEKERRRRKVMRGALIAATMLSIAGVVAVERKKYGLMASDRILKAGTSIQNISPKGRDFNTPFYAVSDKKDKLFYLRAFTKAPTKRDPIGRTTVNILSNDKDVNIAGKKAMDAAYKRAYGNNKVKREIFYRRLGGLKPHQKAKFNNELIKAGYGGHKDINDMQVLFGGDTPMVFFGKASGYKKTKSSEVNVQVAKKIKVLTGVGKRTIQESGAMALGAASVYGLYKTDKHRQKRRRNGTSNKK